MAKTVLLCESKKAKKFNLLEIPASDLPGLKRNMGNSPSGKVFLALYRVLINKPAAGMSMNIEKTADNCFFLKFG